MTHNVLEARTAQLRLTIVHDVPHFAPKDGQCWNCGRDIYSEPHGYTVEYASVHLITGCPYCHKSYVD